jgi:hypothetical protein
VVYAIAAYTITLGVLALYWVMIQHRRREFAAELASLGQGEELDPRSGFNVGASLLAPFWMLKHGMLLPSGLILVAALAVIPLYAREMWTPLIFVGILPIAAGVALGFVANRIGVAYTGLEEAAAFSASQLPWAVVGVLLHFVVLPWVWYFTTIA